MTKLAKNNYKKYLSKNVKDQKFFEYFKSNMPEIIKRTTKLEGEDFNKNFISSLFVSN